MRKSSERLKKSRFSLYDKLPERSRTILAWASGLLFLAVLLFGYLDQHLGDRTMTNCIVSSPSSIQVWKKIPIKTSCGYVYISGHSRNAYGVRPYAVTEMGQAIKSGKPLTIRATGITGMLFAYEITPTE